MIHVHPIKLILEKEYDLRIQEVQDESVIQSSICSTNLWKTQALISDDNCPFWDDWVSGPCSETCGSGMKIVTRNCIQKNEQVDSVLCRKEHPALIQEDKKIESCIEETFCEFDLWGQWSDCTETCGGGKRTRNRYCPSNSCSGESSQTELCDRHECLSQWAEWTIVTSSDASLKRGNGLEVLERECHGPHRCVGKNMKVQDCEIGKCRERSFSSFWDDFSKILGRGLHTNYLPIAAG